MFKPEYQMESIRWILVFDNVIQTCFMILCNKIAPNYHLFVLFIIRSVIIHVHDHTFVSNPLYIHYLTEKNVATVIKTVSKRIVFVFRAFIFCGKWNQSNLNSQKSLIQTIENKWIKILWQNDVLRVKLNGTFRYKSFDTTSNLM